MDTTSYMLMQLALRNRDGSHRTQENRAKILRQAGKVLQKAGYKHLKPSDLKGRHINTLVKNWKDEGLSAGTMKNRMATIRWVAEKVGKSGMVLSNDRLGLEKRVYVTNKDKSRELDRAKLEQVRSPELKLSLELQEQFGLRREESMKFNAAYADKGDRIVLKSSWCKGGREREIFIVNDQQRALLNRVHEHTKNASLIPDHKTYKQQMKYYERETARVGLDKNHGLRHAYAHKLYKDITGRMCPAVGGIRTRHLNHEERKLDIEARQIITRALGHERLDITSIYLGS